MVSNLVVEIAIYNFDLFHYTLLHTSGSQWYLFPGWGHIRCLYGSCQRMVPLVNRKVWCSCAWLILNAGPCTTHPSMAWAMQTLSLCICVQDLCRIIGRGLFSFLFRIDFLWPPCAMCKDCRAFSKCWLSSAQSLGQGHQLPTQSLGQGDISPFQLLHPHTAMLPNAFNNKRC